MIRRLLLLVGVALTLGATPAEAARIGLSDQQATTWSDPRVRSLGLEYARLIVPWDAATNPAEITRVHDWLTAVAAAGLAPHVAFEHLRSDRCPGRPCVTPTRSQYRAAIDAFRARWPQVTTFTTWNEANHSTQPVAADPEVVAGYWAELTSACPGCTVVAGDVLDSGSYVRWLQRFEAAAPTTPLLWGLHNYGDVTYGRTTGTDAVLGAMPGKLWVEETGGIVTLRNTEGRVTLSSSESRAEASIDRAFAIAAARPRIERMYVYHWKAGSPTDRFDAGLLRPDGSTRPSYAAFARHVAALKAAGAASTPAVGAAPTITVRWTKGRRSQLQVRLTCTAPDRRCSGRVRVRLRTKARKGSKDVTVTLGTRSYRTTVAKRTAVIRLNVSADRRARVRRAAVRRVVLRVAPVSPARPAYAKTLAIAR